MKNDRRLFGLLLLLETALFVWLILSRRIPGGHDTLGLYLQQYLFLAQATQSHAVALWMPNTAHGLITNWSASCQGGLFQNALLFLGGVPAGTNHLPIFYAGIFVDQLILLTGIWSLGRRYYSSPSARFFVATAAIGSSFWMNHLVANFRIYYCLPLLLSLTHDFLETGNRWKFFLAFNLAVLQFTGSTPYVPIFILLLTLAYFIVYAKVYRIPLLHLHRRLQPRLSDALTVLVNLGLLVALYASLSHGSSELRLFRPGRSADGSVPLDDFLTHGGALNPIRYLDLFLGLSPSLDFTLYCGILTVACAALGVFHRPGRPVMHLVICLVLILLFSTGYLSAVSMMAYFLAPPLHFFRYVSLVAPVVKLFLILLSGFGFEVLLARRAALGRLLLPLSKGLLVTTAGLAGLVGAVFWRADTLSELNEVLRTGRLGLGRRIGADALGHAAPLLAATTLSAAAAAILLALRARRPEARPLLVAAFLAIHTADLYRWKLQMMRQESVVLTPSLAALQEIQPLPYLARRNPHYEQSERYRAWSQDFFKQGAAYDFTDPMLLMDPPASRFLLTYWLAPFDALLAAGDREPLDRKLAATPAFRWRADDAYAAISGTSADKIQIFSRAHFVGSGTKVAEDLNRPEFRGGVLLLESAPGPSADPEDLSRDERVSAPCKVTQFDFDQLVAKVDLPSGETGAWLMYADVWHPGWTATVNDKPAPIERAFLAYKAVKLDPGSNVVRFRFRDPVRAGCYRLIGGASCFLIVAVGTLLIGLFRHPAAGAEPVPFHSP